MTKDISEFSVTPPPFLGHFFFEGIDERRDTLITFPTLFFRGSGPPSYEISAHLFFFMIFSSFR